MNVQGLGPWTSPDHMILRGLVTLIAPSPSISQGLERRLFRTRRYDLDWLMLSRMVPFAGPHVGRIPVGKASQSALLPALCRPEGRLRGFPY